DSTIRASVAASEIVTVGVRTSAVAGAGSAGTELAFTVTTASPPPLIADSTVQLPANTDRVVVTASAEPLTAPASEISAAPVRTASRPAVSVLSMPEGSSTRVAPVWRTNWSRTSARWATSASLTAGSVTASSAVAPYSPAVGAAPSAPGPKATA